MENSFLTNTDQEKLQATFDQTEDNLKYFEGVVGDLVAAYTQHLDNIMKDLYDTHLCDAATPIALLEEKLFELNNILYFMGDKLDTLSIKTDLAKRAAKEVYNNSYLGHQVKDAVDKKNKTTVAELSAIAERDSLYEATVEDMYEHAESRLKFKIDAGYQMVKAISKILSRRMTELNYDPTVRGTGNIAFAASSKRILNEGYDEPNFD